MVFFLSSNHLKSIPVLVAWHAGCSVGTQKACLIRWATDKQSEASLSSDKWLLSTLPGSKVPVWPASLSRFYCLAAGHQRLSGTLPSPLVVHRYARLRSQWGPPSLQVQKTGCVDGLMGCRFCEDMEMLTFFHGTLC